MPLMATSSWSGSKAAPVVPVARTRPQFGSLPNIAHLNRLSAGDRAADLDRVVLGGRTDDLDRDLLGRALGVADELRAEVGGRRR